MQIIAREREVIIEVILIAINTLEYNNLLWCLKEQDQFVLFYHDFEL